jgi:hypothetical protein
MVTGISPRDIMMQKNVLSLIVSLGIIAWCVYDLWIAPDPGTSGVRIMNYVVLLFGLAGACGTVMKMRSPS